jgi:hypothetical protein
MKQKKDNVQQVEPASAHQKKRFEQKKRRQMAPDTPEFDGESDQDTTGKSEVFAKKGSALPPEHKSDA